MKHGINHARLAKEIERIAKKGRTELRTLPYWNEIGWINRVGDMEYHYTVRRNGRGIVAYVDNREIKCAWVRLEWKDGKLADTFVHRWADGFVRELLETGGFDSDLAKVPALNTERVDAVETPADWDNPAETNWPEIVTAADIVWAQRFAQAEAELEAS